MSLKGFALTAIFLITVTAMKKENARKNPLGVKHVQSEEEFRTARSSGKLVVAKFSAEWCGPCKMIAPVFESLAKKYKDVIFLHIDVDRLKECAASEGVNAMPTFHFYNPEGGKRMDEFMIRGADQATLTNRVDQLAEKFKPIATSSGVKHSLKTSQSKEIVKGKNMSELKKIDPNAKTVDGRQETMLHICAAYTWVEGVIYLMFREPRPDLSIRDMNGFTAFHRIGANNGNSEDRLEVLKLFLDKGQDLNAVGGDGMSIIHWFAAHAWVKELKYLMSRKPKPDLTIRGRDGNQAFHLIGVENKNPEDQLELLKLFLDNEQDLNAIGGSGQSILILFVSYKHMEAVKYLLENTAIDLNVKLTKDSYNFKLGIKTYKDENALDIARRQKMDEIVAILEKPSDNNFIKLNNLYKKVLQEELNDPKKVEDMKRNLSAVIDKLQLLKK